MVESVSKCRYMALVECPDGETYLQPYAEIEDLINLYDSLGDGFSIQEIYEC